MPLKTQNELAKLLKIAEATVRVRLADYPFKAGPNRSKQYESHIALPILCGVGVDDTGGGKKKVMTNAEAARDLAVSRKAEIDLNMTVTRRERIPLEDVEAHNETVLANVAGIIKANEGKKLTAEVIQEIFAEMRRMDEVLATYSRKGRDAEAA